MAGRPRIQRQTIYGVPVEDRRAQRTYDRRQQALSQPTRRETTFEVDNQGYLLRGYKSISVPEDYFPTNKNKKYYLKQLYPQDTYFIDYLEMRASAKG
jgi:hypothetical protein